MKNKMVYRAEVRDRLTGQLLYRTRGANRQTVLDCADAWCRRHLGKPCICGSNLVEG